MIEKVAKTGGNILSFFTSAIAPKEKIRLKQKIRYRGWTWVYVASVYKFGTVEFVPHEENNLILVQYDNQTQFHIVKSLNMLKIKMADNMAVRITEYQKLSTKK